MSEERKVPFSERGGYVQPKSIQIESLDGAARTRLWNTLYLTIFFEYVTPHYHWPSIFVRVLWEEFFTKSTEHFEMDEGLDLIKNTIMSDTWYRVFDLVEFALEYWSSFDHFLLDKKSIFIAACNAAMKKENVGYTIVGEIFSPIASEWEIENIEHASQGMSGSDRHIKKALALFSNRESPDYENSIKESISAVESLCFEITEQKKIKAAVQQLKSAGLRLHPAFESALVTLYGFTSDGSGIRHGEKGEKLNTDQNTAYYMLVVCSAFVNYIKAEYADITSRK